MKRKVLKPNVIGGGQAIPMGDNFYYMRGRKHAQGGIDIGANPKTGLEVEDGEVMHLTNKDIKVYSSVPFLNGKSPAQKVMSGENPTKVFNEQERYKKRKGINDDGSKKKQIGGKSTVKTITNNDVSAPVFNPFTKSWYRTNKNNRIYLSPDKKYKKAFGYTMYSKDGFAINYDNNGIEINRRKGSQTPSITGKSRNIREQKYFDTDKEYTDSVKVISKRYGLNPNLVASRLAREGIDNAIDRYNRTGGESFISNDYHINNISGPMWGLDDFYSNIKNKKTQLIEPWVSFRDESFSNEKGRITESAVFNNWSDIISGTAAELRGRRDRLKKSYPYISEEQLDALSSGSFNYGEEGIKNYIQKNGIQSVYNEYKPFIKLKNNYINNKSMGGKTNNEHSLTRRQYRTGGLYSLTIDGDTRMRQFPVSTGERTKAQYGTVKRTPSEWKRLKQRTLSLPLEKISIDADNRVYSYLNGYRPYIFKDGNTTNNKQNKTNKSVTTKAKPVLSSENVKEITAVQDRLLNRTKQAISKVDKAISIARQSNSANKTSSVIKTQNNNVTKKTNTTMPTRTTNNNVKQVVKTNNTTNNAQVKPTRNATSTKKYVRKPVNNTKVNNSRVLGRNAENNRSIIQHILNTSNLENKDKKIDFSAKPSAMLTSYRSNLPKIDAPTPLPPGYKAPKDSWIKRTMNKLGVEPNDVASLIPNIAGSLITHSINSRMLNNFKEPQAPIARQAVKLKTRINIEPQLDKMRESLAEYERQVDNNTASSNVALAIKNNFRLANIMNTNALYADKENKETELINQDRLNRQSVTDANVREYNEYLARRNQYQNTIAEKRAENSVGLINNINAGIQNMLSNIDRRKAENRNIAAMAFAHPDLPIELFDKAGIVSKEVGDWYREGIGRNRRGMKKTI